MKALVTGAGGMLARDLVPRLSQEGYDVLALPRAKLDVTDFEAARAAANDFGPDIIINCAAYTRVDDAENEERQALLVNGLAVQNLCLVCREKDVPLVHFSTDYIFDGTKRGAYAIYDAPNPLSAYGRSKLLGEQYVLWLLTRFYLIRTSWLFGHHGRNFIETMLELGKKQNRLSVVNDQTGCPTWTGHLADAAVALIRTGRYGVYHVTNSGTTTWFDLAREVLRLSGMDVEVIPTTTDRFPRSARRPLNSVLDPFPLPEVLGREMPPWQEGLEAYLRGRNARLVKP